MRTHIEKITAWIKNYTLAAKKETLVIGISGGIDSSVVSALCAKTGIKTLAVSLPIHQKKELHDLSLLQGEWLTSRYENVTHLTYDLGPTYDIFYKMFLDNNGLAQANTKSRLRMITLYHIAQLNNGLVIGTGNKVEDFGVGFFTKWGDGAVDLSPIGDCLKTQVWEMGKILNIDQKIIEAEPTDGLWSDGRTDRQQLNNLPYEEIEKSMLKSENGLDMNRDNDCFYLDIRAKNLHKMLPIPIYKLN